MGVTVTLLFMEQEPGKLVVFTSPAGTVATIGMLPVALKMYSRTQSGGVDGMMLKLNDHQELSPGLEQKVGLKGC
jgi:hypothetical protein